jgi:ABC-type transport system involved in multi-copper enzyme maturation permease subunit
MTSIITPVPGVSFARVARSEWLKAGTLRSVWATAISAVALTAGFAALIAFGITMADTGENLDPAQLIAQTFGDHPALTTLAWSIGFTHAVVAILGVLIVSSERASGLIAMTIAAVPRRTLVVLAKLMVSAISGAVLGVLAAVSSFLVSRPAFAPHGYTESILDLDVLVSIAGSAAYLALVGVIASSIALLIRSTAAAAGAVLALLIVLPGFVQLIPGIGRTIALTLPSSLGQALYSPVSVLGWPTFGLAGTGLLAWAVVLAVVGSVTFAHRDV